MAPASTAIENACPRNSMSLRLASSAENSTSGQRVLAYSTILPMDSSACVREMRNLCFRCRSEVARKTCTRGSAARSRAPSAASISSRRVRASPATVLCLISRATSRTASKSPCEAMGKPASITSTPRASSRRASRSFSAVFMEKPGACSPSLSVVSKIRTISIAILQLL